MTLIHAQTRLWTRQEYYALAEAGFLPRDQRFELIEGEIVCMSPQGKKHRLSVMVANAILSELFGHTHYVAVQLPMPLSDMSEPEPDFALIPKSTLELEDIDDLDAAQLVLEIAHTSLLYDRTEKASLYARYGVADYWILNVARPGLEVYRDPEPDPAGVHGWSYRTRREFGPEESCAPLFAPDRPVTVNSLLKLKPL